MRQIEAVQVGRHRDVRNVRWIEVERSQATAAVAFRRARSIFDEAELHHQLKESPTDTVRYKHPLVLCENMSACVQQDWDAPILQLREEVQR